MSEPSRSLFENTTGAANRTAEFAFGKSRDEGKDHFKTAGEKKFDFRVYNLIGYVLNAVLSVFAVWGVERTARGGQLVDRLTSGITKTGANAHVARYLANRTFLLVGGFAVLLPMKWMEDRKLQMVKKWNRQIYGEKADTDPVIIQSEREVAEANKQTWSSILWSRIIALIPFYITVGLLWNRTSKISQLTNPQLRELGNKAVTAQQPQWEHLGAVKKFFAKQSIKADAFAAVEEATPITFSRLTTPDFPKGIYFDRPLAWAGRWIGLGAAKLTGNQQAAGRIRLLQQHSPGHIVNVGPAGHLRDPAHSTLPYYVATEAITSGIVAWGVYQLTRILGPLIGKKVDGPSKIEPQVKPKVLKQAEEVQVQPKVEERPATRVDITGIEHQAAKREAAAKRENVSAR